VSDAKLAKVFDNKKPIDMLELSGVLNKHIGEKNVCWQN
jgi:chromatin remodeling complex protein RSC6